MLQETQHIQSPKASQMARKHGLGEGNSGLPLSKGVKEIYQYLLFIFLKLSFPNQKIFKIMLILILINAGVTSILCQNCKKMENPDIIQSPPNIIQLENKVENKRRFNLKEEKNQPNLEFSKYIENQSKIQTSKRALQQLNQNQIIQEDPFQLDKDIRYVIISNSSKPSYKTVQPQLINGYTLAYVVPFRIAKNNQPNQFLNFPSHYYSYSNLRLFRNLTIYKAILYYLNKFYSYSTYDYNSQNDDGYFQSRFNNWNLIQVQCSKNFTLYIYKLVYQMYGNYNTTEEHFTFSYSNETFDLELINYVKIPESKRIRQIMKGNETIDSLLQGDTKQIGQLNKLLKDIIQNRIQQDILYNETLKLFQVTVNEYVPYQPQTKNIFQDPQISQNTNLTRDISIKYYYPVNMTLYYARHYSNNLSVKVPYPKQQQPWRTINRQRYYYLPTKYSPLEYIEFHYTYNVSANYINTLRPTLHPRERFKNILQYDYFLNETISDYIISKNFINIRTQVKVLRNYRSIDRKGVYRTQLQIAPNYNVTYQINTQIQPLKSFQVHDEQNINWMFAIFGPFISDVNDYQYFQMKIQTNNPSQVQFYSIFRRNLSNQSNTSGPALPQISLPQKQLIQSRTNNVPQSISQNKNLSPIIDLLSKNTTWQQIQQNYSDLIQPQIEEVQIILQNFGISRQRCSDVKIRERKIHDLDYCGYVIEFFDKAVNGYVRVQMEVSRSRKFDPEFNYNETRLFQNTLFKSHVYQLPQNHSKRLQGNYTYVQYFQHSAWPVYLYDREQKSQKIKQNSPGISIFVKNREYLQQSKIARSDRLHVDGFRQIFVNRVRQFSINNFIYPESLVVVYRNTSQFKDQYPYYMYLVNNQNLDVLRSPLRKYLSLQTFIQSYAKDQILFLSRMMDDDIVQKLYNLSVFPISYTVIDPDKKQPILRPLLGEYSPTKAQFEQIKEIIYENVIKTIPLNTKLQIKSIRQMVSENSINSFLAITLPMTDRVNQVFYTEIKLFIEKNSKKLYRIQYCKDRYKFQLTQIQKSNINPRDKEATFAAQSRMLQSLKKFLHENGVVTNKLKQKIRVNPNRQSRNISIGVNPVLIRGKDLLGTTRLYQFYYELEEITIKITASYGESIIISKENPNLSLIYLLQIKERKVIKNNLDQLQKQQEAYKTEQIKKIRQSDEFKKIYKNLQRFYNYFGQNYKIEDIYIKRWNNSIQYYIKIEILGIKYGINLLYSKLIKESVLIKMQPYKDQLEFQYVIREIINQHRLGYQQVVVLKGCKKRKLLQGCLECQVGYYLSKDGLCYPSLLLCKVQSGTLCLTCQSGYILTSNYQCI